jgi:hypothetical protein
MKAEKLRIVARWRKAHHLNEIAQLPHADRLALIEAAAAPRLTYKLCEIFAFHRHGSLLHRY